MLRKEIKRCMTDLEPGTNGHFSAHFTFPLEFLGFQGHFPEAPVLPGLCTIQSVLVIVESVKNARPRLEEILSSKFFAVVKPDAELVFTCDETSKNNGTSVIKATASSNGDKLAQLSLRVSFDHSCT